jgi:hypothetical protein
MTKEYKNLFANLDRIYFFTSLTYYGNSAIQFYKLYD